ncbi:MAG: sulfatase-like hydrolase/transferase [Gammaproteobacteria bacterium]|nr:sulfatase-like hydrolase/transferase [Gammaproteobacteria bacterium]
MAGYDTFQTGKWHLPQELWRRSFSHGKAIHEDGMSRHEKGGHWDANFTDFLSQRKDNDKPFMMYVGFLAPHDPLQHQRNTSLVTRLIK